MQLLLICITPPPREGDSSDRGREVGDKKRLKLAVPTSDCDLTTTGGYKPLYVFSNPLRSCIHTNLNKIIELVQLLEVQRRGHGGIEGEFSLLTVRMEQFEQRHHWWKRVL